MPKSVALLFVLPVLAAALSGCGQRSLATSPGRASSVAAAEGAAPGGAVAVTAGNPNGRAGAMPAYYDGKLFTINFKKLPTTAEASLIGHNGSINTIYMSDAGLPGGHPFVSVLDAIQGEGFNPLWVEVQIAFNPGHTPHQLTSDTDVAAAAASGEITLDTTDEVYRCSVIGPR